MQQVQCKSCEVRSTLLLLGASIFHKNILLVTFKYLLVLPHAAMEFAVITILTGIFRLCSYLILLVSIKRQFQIVYIDMKHDWKKKATLIPAVAAKDRDASNLTHHFHWGLPSSQGGTTPKLKYFGNYFYMPFTFYLIIPLQRTYCY